MSIFFHIHVTIFMYSNSHSLYIKTHFLSCKSHLEESLSQFVFYSKKLKMAGLTDIFAADYPEVEIRAQCLDHVFT